MSYHGHWMIVKDFFRLIGIPIGLLTVFSLATAAESGAPVRLYVREVPITIFGKPGKVIAIEQVNGTMGLHLTEADGFNVEVVNLLKEPTSIHWHGLILPALMDGVPFVSQNPIPPNGTFHYQFPLKQSGTYWLHSHYGSQEQLLASAPLILESEEQNAKADEQYTVLLSDYSFTPPAKILARLKLGMPGMGGMSMKKMPATKNSMARHGMTPEDSLGPSSKVSCPTRTSNTMPSLPTGVLLRLRKFSGSNPVIRSFCESSPVQRPLTSSSIREH